MRLMRRGAVLLLGAGLLVAACVGRGAAPAPEGRKTATAGPDPATFWNGATIYFLLTDRFLNGDTTNDHALGRAHDGALLRNFEGGDLAGVRRAIDEGYFDSLGVTAIWLTPFVEQIHGSVDEGSGRTYGYHGYWTRDWTAVDPAFGTRAELHALVDAAHRHRIRVLMDAVINHTGPVTPQDPAWPADWVRTAPQCTYRDYVTTVTCTLVATLPDVRTEREEAVELPPALTEKWQREGRLDAERAGLDAFFSRTGYPRAPRYYIIKWLTDWVREFGFDGYRVDTAKHFEEAVSAALRHEADLAFADWKREHSAQALDGLPFFMMGEVYGYGVGGGRTYSFGDRSVDYFANGYDALINFGFPHDAGAATPLDTLFTRYAAALHGPLANAAIVNYVSSHDDGNPLDGARADPLGSGTRLLLAPGGAQIYYGDELARPLRVPGAQGDANLRSAMNWRDTGRDSTARILSHWRRLGEFRRAHPAVGAGAHRVLQAHPYIFSRVLDVATAHDRVVVAMEQDPGAKVVPVFGVFPFGTPLVDFYSGATTVVRNDAVILSTPYDLVLLGERGAPKPGEAETAREPVTVEVTNNYSLPMEISVVASGAVHRLGLVAQGSTGHFVLGPATLASGGVVEFIAQPSGVGPIVRGGSLQLSGGNVVDFIIMTQLVGSYARIR